MGDGTVSVGTSQTRRLTTVAVVATLMLAGFVVVSPGAAAGACDGEFELGGHSDSEEDPFHICIDIDRPPETIPSVNITCPTCTPGVDPTPPGPDHEPGAHHHTPEPHGPPNLDPTPPLPPEPPTPERDSCIGPAPCTPSVPSILNWSSNVPAYADDLQSYSGQATSWADDQVSSLLMWDPADCGPHDSVVNCAEADPGFHSQDDWAEDNARAVGNWVENAPGRVIIGSEDVVTVQPGDTVHADGFDRLKDEVCEVIWGDGADWQDCAQMIPCWQEECGVRPGVSSDGTPGLVIETDAGSVYVPVTEL